jgi:N-acylglucosamine 2-epimerase
MNREEKTSLLAFHRDHLYNTVLSFWISRAIDKDYGGYYTCFTNSGDELISTDKYVWSQGRLIWIFAKLAEQNPNTVLYRDLAKSGVDFLLHHCFLEDGTCAFLLTREGQMKETVPGMGFHTSLYADCFVAMGFAKYAGIAGDSSVLKKAYTLYESIVERISSGNFRSEPYPIPKGYKAHGVYMIALNTGQAIAEALTAFADSRKDKINKQCESYAQEIMNSFVKEDVVLEMIGDDNRKIDSLLGSYINPGHTIEDMWFIMHHARANGNEKLIEKAAALTKRAIDLGWDKEHGGLFQFIHYQGGKPFGKTEGIENSVMTQKLKTDWDKKLWWPHSEALYTLLLGYILTDDESLLENYRKISSYTFQTFPNTKIGEWVQIRDRKGEPVTKIVALPVKDPFHIMRNLLLIIELLSK